MQYEQAVSEARTLVRRSEEDQWRLAELTWETIEDGSSRRRWAEDIEVTHTHVNTLYNVWVRHGGNQVSTRPKFADAYAAAKGMPIDRSERRRNEADRNVTQRPPEQRAKLARELLSDPNVARLVGEQDPETTASFVRDAIEQVPEAAVEASRALSEQTRPVSPRSDPSSGPAPRTTLDLLLQFQKLHHVVKETVDAVVAGEVSFNDRDRERLFEELAWLRSSLDLIESGIRSGSWDEVVHRILEVQ